MYLLRERRAMRSCETGGTTKAEDDQREYA
jgi:hypothetical protein